MPSLFFCWAVCCCYILYEFIQPTSQADDAYISYRYAQNLVDGHGLIFNVGERVEGYSNLLWTLIVAGGIALGCKRSPGGALARFRLGRALAACYVFLRA